MTPELRERRKPGPKGGQDPTRKAAWVKLRQRGHTYADIAALFGVTRQAIHHAIGPHNQDGRHGRVPGQPNRDGLKAPIEPCASCGVRAPGLFCGSDCRGTWEKERRLAT